MTINERIRLVRRDAGLTLQEFGEEITISASACSSLELGKTNPSPQTVKMICERFRVSADWLRTGKGEMHVDLAAEQEINRFVEDILADDDDTRKRFVLALAKIPAEQWQFIADFWQNFKGD